MPFAATWMQPEIVILSEASQKRKYHITSLYMWNLKRHDTDELTKQTHRLNRTNLLWLP